MVREDSRVGAIATDRHVPVPRTHRSLLPKIGQAFGRDHTTVMYAQKKILNEMASRREVFDHVKELTTRIRQRSKH